MKRILADTGPLVALLDGRDDDHATCVEAARALKGKLVTTWAVLTEALYLLGPSADAQDELLGKVESGDIWIAALDSADIPGIRSLMKKYRDLPMDLADATVVRIADRDHIDTVFTLDDDFRVYRLARGKVFAIVP